MTLARGRIISRSDLLARQISAAAPVGKGAPSGEGWGRVVPGAAVEASLQAEQILARARARAEALIAEAERQKNHVLLEAHVAARAQAAAELSTQALLLRQLENTALERDLDRVVELACALAERLLGQALALDPNTIVALAQQALAEARGARRVRIEAHPEDAVALRAHLELLGITGEVSIVGNRHQARGNLRILTDVGVLEAQLESQLAQLGARLRTSLTPKTH